MGLIIVQYWSQLLSYDIERVFRCRVGTTFDILSDPSN